MNYSEWKTIKVDPLEISLDESNPRVILEDYSQDNIREFLIEYFDVLELAKSIVHSKGIPPTERILCIKENERIVVVEGNRRVTACQILKNKQLIPEQIRVQLPDTSEIDSFLEEIEVVVAPNRDDTENYITMRHTGSGTKRWSRLAENRRYIIRYVNKKESINHIANILNISSYQVRRGIQFYFFIEYIRTELEWTDSELEIINSPLLETTKIDRFLPFSTKAKDVMTIDFDSNHNLIYEIDKSNFDKALKIIVKNIFITNKFNTRSTFDEVFNEEIIEICKSNNVAEKSSIKQTGEITERKDITSSNESSTKTSDFQKSKGKQLHNPKEKENDIKKEKNKRQPVPLDRKYPFEGINYKGSIIGISRTLYELHRINVKNFSFSSTVLIRTLLECTIQEYIIKKKINIKVNNKRTIKDLSIAALLGTCNNNGNGNLKALKKENHLVARILNESHNMNDHDELNLVTHGNYRDPSPAAIWEIERRWYSAVEIMINEISGLES